MGNPCNIELLSSHSYKWCFEQIQRTEKIETLSLVSRRVIAGFQEGPLDPHLLIFTSCVLSSHEVSITNRAWRRYSEIRSEKALQLPSRSLGSLAQGKLATPVIRHPDRGPRGEHSGLLLTPVPTASRVRESPQKWILQP